MNFKRFSTSDNQWHDIPYYTHKTTTDTLTTLPAVLYPNDTTITVGVKGQSSQSGTPAPQNPVDVLGTGERTGNLFDKTWLSDNTQLVPSTGRPNEYMGRIATQNPIDVSNIDSVILTYSLGTSMTENFMYSILSRGVLIERVAGKVSGSTIDVSNADELYIGFYIGGRNITTDNVLWIMLNSGSTALPYEPYGYKIPISSANTTTPVYLVEVETTRKIKKLVLTGEERWSADWRPTTGTYATLLFDGALKIGNVLLCTHHEPRSYDQLYNGTVGIATVQSNTYLIAIRVPDTVASNGTEFKAFLAAQYAAGTPVTVWYVLAEPTTGVVNEPLMKIGDYADEVSGITIPTTAGKDTFDVETTLKPSEVSLSYTGWHDATVKEWDGSQWQ